MEKDLNISKISNTEYDKLNIQQKSQTRTKKNTAYGMYTDYQSTSDGRRKEYVKIFSGSLRS